MSVLNFFVKEYTGPGDWILVSRVLLNSAGIGRRFSVECCEGLVWCCEFVVDEVAGGEDLVRRVRVGDSLSLFEDFFVGLGFGVVLPEGFVFFE